MYTGHAGLKCEQMLQAEARGRGETTKGLSGAGRGAGDIKDIIRCVADDISELCSPGAPNTYQAVFDLVKHDHCSSSVSPGNG